MSSTAEKHTFQAEVNEVLSLVVNSLYSHREVFLRELISNSASGH
jgi:molecular chaperone HtpG